MSLLPVCRILYAEMQIGLFLFFAPPGEKSSHVINPGLPTRAIIIKHGLLPPCRHIYYEYINITLKLLLEVLSFLFIIFFNIKQKKIINEEVFFHAFCKRLNDKLHRPSVLINCWIIFQSLVHVKLLVLQRQRIEGQWHLLVSFSLCVRN